MTRTFMALCLSATIALGGFTAKPAYASDGQGVATAVLGALALYAIARELNDDDDKKKKKRTVSRTHHHHGYTHSHGYTGPHGHNHGHIRRAPSKYQQHAHVPNRRHPRAVPARCVRDNPHRNGPSRFVTRRCLNDKGYTRKLPSQCAFTFRGRNQQLRAYGLRCLRHNGYWLEARR